jgi:hypothetical protein
MAMNKSERSKMERLCEELRIAKAMRFTEKVEPDLMPPESFGGLVNGYLYNAYYSNPCVEPACTSSTSHGFGSHDKTNTQQPRRLYSSRLLAWKACRNDLEKQFSRVLAEVDAQIEKELTPEGTA